MFSSLQVYDDYYSMCPHEVDGFCWECTHQPIYNWFIQFQPEEVWEEDWYDIYTGRNDALDRMARMNDEFERICLSLCDERWRP